MPIRRFFAVFSVVLSWVYALLLIGIEFGQRCTMGGEGLLPSLFIGGPMIVIVTVVLWLQRPFLPLSKGVKLTLAPALAAAAAVCLLQIWNVTVLSQHPCGPDYNAFRPFMEVWDRWIPVVNLGLIAIAALVAFGPWARTVDSRYLEPKKG